ncbi:MAG: CoA transferase [Paracoccaceae bacterium]
MLADIGADVIKVERPAGDDTRRAVPPEVGGESAAVMMMWAPRTTAIGSVSAAFSARSS